MKIVKKRNSPEKPKRKKVARENKPDNTSTKRYLGDILDLQLLHFPLSKSQEITGILK